MPEPKGGSHVQQIQMALWNIPVAFLLHFLTGNKHVASAKTWLRRTCVQLDASGNRVKTCPYNNWKQNGACCPGIFDDLWNCTKIAGFLTGKLLRISESSLTQLFKGDRDPASLFSGPHVFIMGCGGFHKWELPKTGWFIVETPLKTDDLRVPPFQRTSM